MHVPGEGAHEQVGVFRETPLQNPTCPPSSISQPAC